MHCCLLADEIWVEHRKSFEEEEKADSSHKFYGDQLRSLLHTGMHSDVTFVMNDDTSVHAHRAILSARSVYFEAMFRIGGMSESSQKEIMVTHDAANFKRMLEFIYSNSVSDLATVSSNEVIALLCMANEYLLSDLRELCENRAATMINMQNISKLLLLSAGHNASVLKDACGDFVQRHRSDLAADPIFRQDIEANSELGLLLFESSIPKANMVGGEGGGSSSKKRRRTSDPAEADLDLVPPHLNGNPTNTISQSNANVQDA